VEAEDPSITQVSYEVFGLVKNAVAVGGRGEG
jgi:hypothetical protein